VTDLVAESSRLLLRRWSDADVEPLAQIGTAEVVRYLGGTPWTVTTAQESIDLWRQIEGRLGVTTWAVCERGSGDLIGTCGFAGTNMPWLRFDFVIEIGWTFASRWWGQGYATEAALAALDVGLRRYPQERILSKCHIENHASERVMQRIGMHRVGIVQGTLSAPTILHRLK
jgi:RimJ/RimL family protein N-acetyltransferase